MVASEYTSMDLKTSLLEEKGNLSTLVSLIGPTPMRLYDEEAS
jgi:hypothetical protein